MWERVGYWIEGERGALSMGVPCRLCVAVWWRVWKIEVLLWQRKGFGEAGAKGVEGEGGLSFLPAGAAAEEKREGGPAEEKGKQYGEGDSM